ncbi:MAG TPA: Imm8 family immunity protein [Lentisphaeria bacterium]|nr:Imm8 family immunity protein [Lentisphaeria bacterium]
MSAQQKIFCIKEIVSSDITEALENYCPIRSDFFSITLQIIVGSINHEGGESFCLEVCTPQYLLENFNRDDMIWGRHYLIVFEYNFPKIRKKIDHYFSAINTESWEKIVEMMSRIGLWEFEDYKE